MKRRGDQTAGGRTPLVMPRAGVSTHREEASDQTRSGGLGGVEPRRTAFAPARAPRREVLIIVNNGAVRVAPAASPLRIAPVSACSASVVGWLQQHDESAET